MTINGQCCTICDRPATALWHGVSRDVAICPACAVDVLPALAADAVYIGTRESIERTADRMKATYWRAMTLRMIRGREGAK